MKDDPVIAEIRRIRHELSEKFGHDPKLLIKFLQEQEKLHSERVVYFSLLLAGTHVPTSSLSACIK